MTEIELAGEAHPDRADVAAIALRVADAQARAEALALTDTDADTAGMAPAERRAALNARRDEMDRAREELRMATDEMRAAVERQLAEVSRSLAPLRARADELTSAAEAISLYLGSDEQIVLLREGEPAPADTPIVVYQEILFMDEEMALAAEAAGIEDATIDPGPHGWAQFDDWLLASDTHVRQVCPAPRGIVALRSARTNRSNRPGSLPADDGSELTHFLIVNGDQLAWVNASEDFTVGDRLIPTANEFDEIFTDPFHRDSHGQRERLKVGTAAWDRAQSTADKRQKHYLKIALILQGIVDRSALLSPLPADNLSFTTPDSYDAGHIIAVVADDGTQLPSGVMPYRSWHREVMTSLEPGHRVVVGTIPFDARYDTSETDGLVRPNGASLPESGVPHELKRRRNGSWYISYRRTDRVWRDRPIPERPGWVRPQLVTAEGWASLSISEYDEHILPIDHPMVTIETLEWYLLSRENRRHFQDMIRLLRSALRVLLRERDEEQPFIDLLTADVATTHNLDEQAAADIVASTALWWKTKRRQHRPLLPAGDVSAYNEIRSEIATRLELEARPLNDTILERIAADVPYAIWVGRRRDGSYMAIEPCNDRDVYVNVHTWSAKQGRRGASITWDLAPDVRHLQTIRSSARHDSWPRFPDIEMELTDPEIDQIVEQLRDKHDELLAVTWEQVWSGGLQLRVYAVSPGDAPQISPDHPLTDSNEPGHLTIQGYTWKRTGGRIELSRIEYWSGKDRAEITAPGRPRQVGSGRTYWIDEPRLAEATERLAAAWAEHLARVEPLRATTAAAHHALDAAWTEAAVVAEHRRFVEKYGAESIGRWETHRKTVERSRLMFRHGRAFAALFDHAAELHLLDNVGERTVDDLVAALDAAGVTVSVPDDARTAVEGLRF